MIWGFDYEPELEYRRLEAERGHARRRLRRSARSGKHRPPRMGLFLEGLGVRMVTWGCQLQSFAEDISSPPSGGFESGLPEDMRAGENPSPC